MTETVPNKSDDWAIALVHGIGNTDRLKMIQEVCEAIKHARPELKLEQGAEVHEVREVRDKDGNISEQKEETRGMIKGPLVDSDDTYVRYNVIRHGHVGNGTFRIGTAHWADIAYYRQGFLNLIGALMMTAFGVRFFAEVAASAGQNDNIAIRASSWLQRRVLKLIVQILALVVFPITFVSLILSCMGLIGIYVFKTQLAGWQKEFIAVASFGLCVGAAIIGIRRSWEFRKERPLAVPIFCMLAAVGFLVSLAMLLGDRLWISIPGRPLDFYWQGWHGQAPGTAYLTLPLYIRETLVSIARFFMYVELADRFRLVDETAAYFALMHGLQLVAGISLLALTLVATLNLGLLSLLCWASGNTVRTYVFATISVITIWIINLVLLWPENLATFAAMVQFMDDKLNKETITITGINWTTWSIETLHIGLADEPRFRPGFMYNRYYSDTYPMMWFEAIFIVFLALTALLVLTLPLARALWRLRHRSTPLVAFSCANKAEIPEYYSWPRMIVSGVYVSLVVLLIIVVPGLLLVIVLNALGFGKTIPLVATIGNNLPQDLTVGAEWARAGVILFLVLFLLFSHLIREGARLVLDVVNHFTPGPARSGATRTGTRRKRGDRPRFPVRRRIERRFDEMIDALLSRGDKPNLLIVAHSQGTVITLDGLLSERWMSRLLPRVASLTVVTFGSPITHVYQRYFPRLYRPFRETSLLQLSQDPRVKWFNVYRIDDFVGTYVDNSIAGFPVNIPAPPGGHTSYWQEDVMQELFCHPKMEGVLKGAPRA